MCPPAPAAQTRPHLVYGERRLQEAEAAQRRAAAGGDEAQQRRLLGGGQLRDHAPEQLDGGAVVPAGHVLGRHTRQAALGREWQRWQCTMHPAYTLPAARTCSPRCVVPPCIPPHSHHRPPGTHLYPQLYGDQASTGARAFATVALPPCPSWSPRSHTRIGTPSQPPAVRTCTPRCIAPTAACQPRPAPPRRRRPGRPPPRPTAAG